MHSELDTCNTNVGKNGKKREKCKKKSKKVGGFFGPLFFFLKVLILIFYMFSFLFFKKKFSPPSPQRSQKSQNFVIFGGRNFQFYTTLLLYFSLNSRPPKKCGTESYRVIILINTIL